MGRTGGNDGDGGGYIVKMEEAILLACGFGKIVFHCE